MFFNVSLCEIYIFQISLIFHEKLNKFKLLLKVNLNILENIQIFWIECIFSKMAIEKTIYGYFNGKFISIRKARQTILIDHEFYYPQLFGRI